jgi:hypothetical protein
VTEYFPIIPTAVLVLQVIFDMFFIESRGFKKPTKFDPNALVAGGFVLAIALFMSFGIGQGIKFLAMSGTSEMFAQVFAVLSLFAGYQLSKTIDKRHIEQISNEDTKESYLKLRHYLGYTSSAVAFFFISIFIFLFVTDELRSQAQSHLQNTNNSSMSQNYVTPSPTPIPTPTIPTTQILPTKGLSYGVFYPFNQDVTINNNMPTIIGKVSQSEDIYLNTKYGIETSVASNEEHETLRFIPGRVKNIIVKIDGVELQDVFGIPQYPTVTCRDSDKPNGLSPSSNSIFSNENECIEHKKADLPPLVFFAKTTKPLTNGTHTIALVGPNTYETMTFIVDTSFNLSTQTIYSIKDNEYWKYPLIHSVTCAPGYYYDKNFINMPLPLFDNKNLLYGISYPQTKAELGNHTSRRVQIGFDGTQFDLFFPSRAIFYGSESVKDQRELFLPQDHLFFANGQKAKYIDAYSIIPQDGNYATGYYEIFPIDTTGGRYKNSTIPRTLSGSSGCDG